MTNCPKVYKNLQCESFGDRKKITSQMLRQFCKNDAYLYDQIMALWDETDPKSKKRFYPPDYMDLSRSFGIISYVLQSPNYKEFFKYHNTVYKFNNLEEFHYIFNYNNNNETTSNIYYGQDGSQQYIRLNADSYLDLENNYDELMLEIVRDGDVASLRPPLQSGHVEEIIHHDDTYTTCKKKIKQKPVSKAKYVTKKKEQLGKAKRDAWFKHPNGTWHCNSWWYNGFNRTKNYSIKAKWKKDPDSYDIPAVCHAQSFKAKNTGRLSKVNLNMQGGKSTKSPCIVEIRPMKNGKPSNEVLARTEKRFNGGPNTITAFEFTKKAKVKKGKHYAIVVRSPLSKFSNCYRIGGWTTGCFSSSKKYYGDGSAFTSQDNGKTWVKNGKTSDTKSYGVHWYDWGIAIKPVDFAFEVYVQPISYKTIKEKVTVKKKSSAKPKYKTYKKLKKAAYDEVNTYQFNYYKDGSYYMHLKPIQTNPIDSFIIEDVFTNGLTDNEWWTWEYYDNYSGEWIEYEHHVDLDNNRTNYTVLMLRVRCDVEGNTFGQVLPTEGVNPKDMKIVNKVVSMGKMNTTPLTFLKHTEITINCRKPTKAYLRSLYYHPPRGEILGASIWSEIDAKALPLNRGSVEIDVIHEKEAVENFRFYDLDNIKEMTNMLSSVGRGNYSSRQLEMFDSLLELIIEYSGTTVNFSTGQQIIDYIYYDGTINEGFVKFLQRQINPIYLLPLTTNSTTVEFFDNIKLSHLPAYPVIGGDVGDSDIIIDTSKIGGKSNYGAFYVLPCDVRKQFNGVFVTYTTYVEEESNTISDVNWDNSTNEWVESQDENDDIEVSIDEDGFEIENNESQEFISEELKGIMLETNIIYSMGSVVSEDIFKNDSNVIDTSVDYAITKNGKVIIFNLQSPVIQKIFPNCLQQSGYNFDVATTLDDTTVNDFTIKVDLMKKAYQEFVDFEVDYDNGLIEFYNQDRIIDGDFKLSYNPLWVRGLSVEDFPLKMDLWKEYYRVSDDGIYKLIYDAYNDRWLDGKFYEKTNIHPLTGIEENNESFYRLKTSVPPLDSIRKLVVNEEENDEGGNILDEDSQFFVDYLSNTIVFRYSEDLNTDDVITVRYTPNLTDNGLALGYRLKRPRYRGEGMYTDDDDLTYDPNDDDDVYIGMHSYTYRT